jgi:hypothetical protein
MLDLTPNFEKAEFDAKLKAREKRAAKTGRTPGGKPPAPPSEAPRAEDQVNLTDDESRIMKVAGGGFDQCYNAQAMVDTETMLVIVCAVTQAANDKQQVEPMLKKRHALPEGLNAPASLLADTGYFSADNVDTCHQAKVEPLIATGREGHHPHWQERFSEPAPLAASASAVDTMVQAVHAAGFGQRRQRMDAGLSGVEFETAGRIAPAIRPASVKPGEKAWNTPKFQIEERKVIKKCANLNRDGRFARSATSSPTGC